MKTTLFVLPTMFACATTSAQITVAPIAGLNVSSYTGNVLGADYNNKVKLRFGPCAGALADFVVKGNLSLQVGVLYKMNGYHTGVNGPKFSQDYIDLTVSTLDVPVRLIYSLSRRKRAEYFIGAGPYIATNISGSSHLRLYTYDMSGNPVGSFDIVEKLAIGGSSSIRRMEGGIGINAGYRAVKGLLICLQGQYGLVDHIHSNALNYNFGIVGGYTFKLKKHKAHLEPPADPR